MPRADTPPALLPHRTALLEEIFRQSPAFLHVLRGPDFVFEFANEAYYKLVGRRDLIGRPAFEAIPEAASGGYPERLARVMATGEPFVGHELPVTLVRTAGAPPEERVIDLVYLPLFDPDGTCSRVLGHGTDVTDLVRARRRAEAAVRDAASRQALLIGLVAALNSRLRPLGDPEAIQCETARLIAAHLGADRVRWAEAGAGGDGLVVVCEHAEGAQGCSGYRHEDANGHEALRAVREGRTLVHTGAEGDAMLSVPLHRDGRAAAVLFVHHRSGHPFATEETALLEFVANRSWDAIERARLFQAERAARAEAEAANRSKSEFLAVMSHELRTPLNAIAGYAELLELGIHGPVTDAQRADLARIQHSQRHLLGLISRVLDYSRVEAGAVTYRVVPVPVCEAVAEAEVLVAPQLREKGLGFTWSGAPPELKVLADREKLQQILLNLLGNAVKFTHSRGDRPGHVEVSCTTVGTGAAAQVQLRVRDTGQGISSDQIERIFEPFVQADQRLTRPHEGVGLGLAISRDLARGMRGDLTVESTLGEGTTFTLTLPQG